MLYSPTRSLWLIPLISILLLTPFSSTIDLAVARYFFANGHFQSNSFLNFLYSYGMVPGWILTLFALLFLVLSYLHPFWKCWRPYALIPLLTMIVGAGIIVDLSLKGHWGRPRPKQLEEFGGLQHFRPFYQPNFFHQPEPSKSFPSGHCSMGFVFLSLTLIGRRLRQRWLYWWGTFTSVILGALLGYTRMAQGGHFFTDVIFAAAFMWWTALFFDWLIFEQRIADEKFDKETV
ncbi:phosphatase PAP2 family protein [Neochlamydia sp. AcF65]|uniref:phosphatase PAP2 family protein n=1 Tax=Neochlamydia sp. AcF65 TaxID=2795735 RepID=UPI001BC992BF|nr:phosphatase PAP2 family protein [Neochlamydia sp. AcF65]